MADIQKLAVLGGTPVCDGGWPAWPQADDAVRRAVDATLTSGRWAISGPRRGGPSVQERLERAWAEYNGVAHAIAVSSGSSALVTAMEALDIGPGDEVIVPDWTWVASASTVLRTGAKPVLVDVDPGNFCISAETVAGAITPRTKAIVGVHLHQTMMHIEPLLELARAHGLFFIEDCAQAHGALYDGRRAGSFGDVACFSFQQTKPLTCGEGGMVMTNSDEIAERVFELHADGRRRIPPDPVTGLELGDSDGPMGANHGMSEVQAAILLAQMEGLDARLAHAADNAAWLDAALPDNRPLRALVHPARMQRRTVFEYILSFDPEVVERVPIATIGAVLTAETGTPWYASDPPLHDSALYRPGSKRRFAEVAGATPGRARFPVATDFASRSIACHHSVLLAPRRDVARLVAAFDKVLDGLDQLETLAS
jgi:L-glutamine:2-deoxy-scyllo-inosose/3-amino-2,3-dideoxy-scyllo-inosose aminotransferase